MGTLAENLVTLTGNVLVFCLTFGMASSVDTKCFRAQMRNAKAVMTGILLQFLLMPFLGFLIVKSLNINYVTGLMILAVTCSPGGSYSNWWCSLFNADLALSVTMTAVSTLLSVIMMPFNLYIYSRLAYDEDIIDKVDWGSLYRSIFMIIVAIGAGFFASFYFDSHDFNLNANRLGNAAGAALVVFSLIMSNSNSEYQLWDRDWSFYFGVAMPCLLGLVIATGITTCLWLLAPERVTVSIECCFQNVSVALTIATAIFDGDELAEAIGVPVFYGIVEAVFVSIYCIWAWQGGWTKAPTDISLWKALTTSYEIYTLDEVDHHPTREIQLPTTSTTKQQKSDGGGWDYVDYGDAGANEPKSNFIDYTEEKAKTESNSEPEKEEPLKAGSGWFSFM